MSLRILSLLCAVATGLVAADSGLQLAPRGLDQLSRQKFQHFLSQLPSKGAIQGAVRIERTPRVCSIPLRELKVQPSRRFPMEIIPLPKGDFDRIVGPNPAPACKGDEGK